METATRETRSWVGWILCSLLVTTGFSAGAAAQELPAVAVGPIPAEHGNDCTEGEIYDDGTAEYGYSGDPALIDTYEIQQLFNPNGLPLTATTVCVLLMQDAGDGSLEFEVVAYDGTAGSGPTTELGSLAVTVSDISPIPDPTWYVIDITSLLIEIENPAFLGLRWDPGEFPGRFIGADGSPPTVRHPSFERFLPDFEEWDAMSQRPHYRAMMIRAELDDGAPPAQIALVAEGRWVQGMHTVDLSWDGATSSEVDVFRNSELIATVPNDGFYTDSTDVRGRGVYVYTVCEADTSNCSDGATVRFGGPPPG